MGIRILEVKASRKLFLKNCLKGSHMEMCHLLAHTHNIQDWAILKPAMENLVWIYHMDCRNPTT